MYIIYEQRLLLGKVLFFFFCFVDAETIQAAPSFSVSLFLVVSLSVSYCRSFLLQSPYFQSPECHKAPRQKETQFPESSLQTSSLQLKTATHLCQRMAHFMSDTSASLLLQSFFSCFFNNSMRAVVLKALAPKVWNEMLSFHFTQIILWEGQGSASYSSGFFWRGYLRKTYIDVAFKSWLFNSNLTAWPHSSLMMLAWKDTDGSQIYWI